MTARATSFTRGGKAKQKPILLRYRSSKYFIVAVIFFMTFTDIFLYGIIVPVVPRALQERAGIPPEEVQTWISILLATYGGALLISSPIFGYLADKSQSRQCPLLIGLFILAGATAMLCVGTNKPLWVIGRALQGSSAAMVWTVGLALLSDSVKQEELGKYLGIVSLGLTGGTLTGPLLGGVLYDHGGYYAVFGLSFGIIAFDIILRIVLIEKKNARKYYEEEEEDSEYRALNSEQSQGPGYGSLAPEDSIDPSDTVASPENGEDTLKPRQLSVPPVIWLLGQGRLLVGMVSGMVFAIMLTGFDAVLPIFVQETFGWSSTGSGVIFLAVFIPSLCGPLVGSLTDRYGPRWLSAGGLLLAAPFYVLLRFVDHNSTGQEVLLCFFLLMIGSAITLVSTPTFTEIINVVDAKEREFPGIFGPGGASAQAYGLFNMSFAAGTILGPLFAGFVKDRGGWGMMGWTFGLLTGVTSIPVFLSFGGWIGNRKRGANNA